MDKQYAFAVILIIVGIGLSQSGDSDSFYIGLGIGTMIMGCIWVVFRLIKELKKNNFCNYFDENNISIKSIYYICLEKDTLQLD